MPANAARRRQAGQLRGGPCIFTSEFSEERCGAPATRWNSAVGCYLCEEHDLVVTQQFAAAAVEMAGDVEW